MENQKHSCENLSFEQFSKITADSEVLKTIIESITEVAIEVNEGDIGNKLNNCLIEMSKIKSIPVKALIIHYFLSTLPIETQLTCLTAHKNVIIPVIVASHLKQGSGKEK